MHQYLRRLTDERESLIGTATGITDRAAAEERDLTETEAATLASLQARGAELDAQLETYSAQEQSQRAYAQLRERLGGTDPSSESQPAGGQLERRGGVATLERASWGQALIESDALRSYVQAGARGRSQGIVLPGVLDLRAPADPIMLANIPAAYLPNRVVEPRGPVITTPLISVVARETVSTNTVEFIVWGPNPMPPAAIVAEGALKPFVDITSAPTTASLDTYAGAKVITRQALEDFPRIRSIVEGKLQESLVRAVEAGVTTGMNSATAATATGPDVTSAIRAAIGELQGRGYTPNAVAINPADWAELDITGQSTYSQGGFWGLTPVAAPGITAGSPVVGEFSEAITVFDRGQTEVFVSDSHADLFLRNQLVILAEARFLVAVVDPAAMVKAAVATIP